MPRGVKRGRGRPRKIVAKKIIKRADKAQEVAVRKNGPVNEESKALFLNHHLPAIAKFKEQLAKAQSNLRNGYKGAKRDGFLQRDFDTAFKLRTETGEKEIKALIARDGTIAKWLGYGLGRQLDLFLEADQKDQDRKESFEQQAYSDGEQDSRSNRPASPLYASDSPGYEAYMQGYQDHQALILEGVEKLEEPASGVAMTRSQFKAQQRLKAQADAAEDRALFKKRSPESAA
jgi:hypothetical protein